MTPEKLAALTRREREEIAQVILTIEQAAGAGTLRAFAESPLFCNLTLSPLMAAIMDASEGIRPTTIDTVEFERYFGCPLDKFDRTLDGWKEEHKDGRPRTVVIRAGGRGGKSSRLVAPFLLHSAWTVPLRTIAAGEEAVALIMAPDLTLAHQTLSFVKGYVNSSVVLSAAKVDESTEHVAIRRPHDGAIVNIRVRAASRAGRGGRAFTLVAAALDEACIFRDEATGVVNDAELYRAAIQRIVPEGQCWLASTPWISGSGVLEEKMAANWGTHEQALCVIAPTRALNPTWDPDHTIERDMRESDPDNASREIDAIPLVAGSSQFFDQEVVNAATDDRAFDLPPVPGGWYGAGGDFAFRRNSSCQAIVWREERPDSRGGHIDHFHVAYLEEQRPTPHTPLKPSYVVDIFSRRLKEYGIGEIACDSHEREQVSAEFDRHNVTVVAAPEGQPGKAECYVLTRTLLREGRLHLMTNGRLKRQLLDVTSKPMPGGGLALMSPHRTDGSHGDLVSALVVAVWKAQGAKPEARYPMWMVGQPEMSW